MGPVWAPRVSALLEVVYADILLPMLDTVVVLREECDFVLEKVGGIILQARSPYAYLPYREGRRHHPAGAQPLRPIKPPPPPGTPPTLHPLPYMEVPKNTSQAGTHATKAYKACEPQIESLLDVLQEVI